MWSKLFGDTNARFLRRYGQVITDINHREEDIQKFSDDQLRSRVIELRSQVQSASNGLDTVISEMFALTRESAKRAIGQRHYDVQLIGGLVLHQGKIAEMKTGEGKTLVATLPLALNALSGKGAHLVTVNDYLAKRDAGWMGGIYHRLGLSCAAIVHEAAWLYDPSFTQNGTSDPLLQHLRPISRSEAYHADITYGTNNEFGFDYLRDNMVIRQEDAAQRLFSYAIVDEVDSILIDEARTPLIISAPVQYSAQEYGTVDRFVKQLAEKEDFQVDEKMHAVFLTDQGISKLERLLRIDNLYAPKSAGLLNIIQQALKANSRLFERDKQYVVRNGEIIIVDEFTGRLMPGRRYSEGLHQAIEAKEGVEIKQESQTLATITFQNLFRLYGKLAGMTGTAATEAEEFHKIYGLDVVVIPPNKPIIRQDSQDQVYKTETGKFSAVVQSIRQRQARGQPVLAGTISIAKNEILSELLSREGIAHEVLNAKNHEREAHIIAQAGKPGAVTIATNMAGRGVDIILGGNPPDPSAQAAVKELGGLHVIGTERHESRRIDLQLRGRSGRQGDPGSSQFFVSMEDDLMRIFGSERMKSVMDRLGVPDDMPIENALISRSIESAQKKVEGHNFDIRKHLVEYDDVMNKHREVIYRKRREVLLAPPDTIRDLMLGLVESELQALVTEYTTQPKPSQWNIGAVVDRAQSTFHFPISDRSVFEQATRDPKTPGQARTSVFEALVRYSEDQADALEKRFGDRQHLASVLRIVFLQTIDRLWIEHLDQMEHLREGINLRGYGQRDPLVEYKREAYRLFNELIATINEHTAHLVFHLTAGEAVDATSSPRTLITRGAAKTSDELPAIATPATAMPAAGALQFPASVQNTGRNDPCPCGSGKKFKKCFLANSPDCRLLQNKR